MRGLPGPGGTPRAPSDPGVRPGPYDPTRNPEKAMATPPAQSTPPEWPPPAGSHPSTPPPVWHLPYPQAQAAPPGSGQWWPYAMFGGITLLIGCLALIVVAASR